MPVTPKQRSAMGDARADECLKAQARARGSSTADGTPLPGPRGVTSGDEVASSHARSHRDRCAEFPRWTPRAYADEALSALDWARLAALDANAGSRKSMNHVCLPKTCHKGRLAKLGFCRMFFWHWAQRRSKKGKHMVMARVHGHALQSRWSDGEWPPVQRVPPQAGMPGLERNHAYHCRMTPGVFLGARCNHGLSILLRLPVLCDRLQSLLAGSSCDILDAIGR